jgi:hypothetical protein
VAWNQRIRHACEPALLNVNVSAANFGEFHFQKRGVGLELRFRDFADFHGRVGLRDYGNKRHRVKNS